MAAPRILAFSGSLRRESLNHKAALVAAEGARRAGAEVSVIQLRDFPLPVYDADLEAEAGLPAHAVALKQRFMDHDGLLLACPEYNSSITAALKNAIDWVSRPAPGEGSLAAFAGKAAVLMSASPGALGGLRGLVHVRAILGNINVLVLPQQVAIPKAHEAFQPDGRLKDARQQASLEDLGKALADVLRKLKG